MDARTFTARRLTPAGMELHREHFNPTDEFGRRAGKLDRAPTVSLLEDPAYSEELSFDLVLPETLPESKLAAARTIVRAFGARFDDHLHDAPLWNWLTLRFHDQVAGEDGDLKEQSVYTVYPAEEAYGSTSVRLRQYRHRLWGPSFVYSRMGEVSRVMLTGKISEMSDVLDAVVYYNLFSKGVITAVDAMYHDEESGKLTGKVRLSKNLDGGLREGSIRDCLAQIGQIAATRAVHLMTPEQILNALPTAEFGRHVEAARLKLGLFKMAA